VLAISDLNTVFELFSPRGTDDFTMATATRSSAGASARSARMVS
jgi:hypothetical protein